MDKVDFDLPFLFADHHVIEVRRILLSLPGVIDVYASSAFQTVEVSFDDAKVSAVAIQKALEVAGYLSELPYPSENASPTQDARARRLTADDPAVPGIRFARSLPKQTSSSWPCPGLGLLKK